MYQRANISFFESLANSRERVVVYDQSVQNAWKWWENIRDAWNGFRLGANVADPRMATLFHLLNPTIRKIQNTMVDVRQLLMQSAVKGATDLKLVMSMVEKSHSDLVALSKEYRKAIASARSYFKAEVPPPVEAAPGH